MQGRPPSPSRHKAPLLLAQICSRWRFIALSTQRYVIQLAMIWIKSDIYLPLVDSFGGRYICRLTSRCRHSKHRAGSQMHEEAGNVFGKLASTSWHSSYFAISNPWAKGTGPNKESQPSIPKRQRSSRNLCPHSSLEKHLFSASI